MKSVKHILVSTLLALTLAVSLSAASANSNAETQNDLINNGDFALEPNIDNGDYDSAKTNTWFENAGIIKSTGQECPHKIEWTDGYITFSGRTHNTRFFHYNPGITLTPGTYTLSFDVKTAVEGEVSNIRFAVSDVYVQKNSIKISNEWTTVTADFEVNTTTTSKFSIYGGTAPTDIHSFCLDNFTLVQTSVVEPEPIDMTVPLSISEPLPQGNLLKGTDFDTSDTLANWELNTQKLYHRTDENGGYLESGNLITNYHGFRYTVKSSVPAGNYRFIGYLRTAQPGEVSHLRIHFTEANNNYTIVNAYVVSNEWTKVDTYITLSDRLARITVNGGPSMSFMQEYCFDAFSLVPVDSIPEGGDVRFFGTPVNASQAEASNVPTPVSYEPYDKAAEDAKYEIQGIIINQDADSFISSCVGVSKQTIIDYAKMFRDTHITDYVICLNNTNVTYPSEVWNDLLDKYYQKVENGQPVDYSNNSIMKGAHHVFEELGTDYIALWMDAFREVDINPWISIRMNDAHDIGKETSHLLSDYYHNNPQIRRVQNGSALAYGKLADYTHESHREHVLALVNEALSRYDCYGLELDFQRQIYLWYYGGEYNGIDILNDFMRDVDGIIAIYEKKYGHEIKLNVCVASDIQTNYDFGLDVMTWVKEGIVDMVTPKPMNRQQNDIPIAHWDTMLEPYGTDLSPAVDMWVMTNDSDTSARHSLETFSAAAANILSQGGDKVYMYNFYLGAKDKITEEERITSKDNEISILTLKGYHNVVTTLGSYDKLMTMNRRMVLTYNDTRQVWVNNDAQVPVSLMKDKAATLRIPMGDIPEGAKVTLKFSSNHKTEQDTGIIPDVLVNSVPAVFEKAESNGLLTAGVLLCYTVPESVHDDMILNATITAKEYIDIDYAEVYIEAPEDAAAPKKAEKTPSSWAAEEVNAAKKAKIVPASLQKDYTDKITRNEFCTLIMAMLCKVSEAESSHDLLSQLGIEYIDSFTDTNNQDIIAANLIGIVSGRGEGIFDPNSGITRQEAAKMLANTASLLGITGGTAPEFADIGTASSWAVDSIKATASIVSRSGKSVMGGVGEGNFAPLGVYTREQSILTVYRLFDSAAENASVAVNSPVSAVAAEKNTVPSPAVIKPAGTSGIVLRANAGEINVNRVIGTQVTDVILTIGSEDASGVINALRNAGINVYIAGYADVSAVSALEHYDADGIELDFITSGILNNAAGDTYSTLDSYADMIASVNDRLAAYEAKYGHDIKVSVRIPSDVMPNYYMGLNVVEWAQDGIVDMICPSGNTVSDTDMSVRLWYSLLESYDVTLAPVISDVIKTRSRESGYNQTPATLAGEAANMLSKGADKVSVGYSIMDDASLNTIGSYDSLMSVERRIIPTYTDTLSPWQPSDEQLPITLMKNNYDVVHIPMCDTSDAQTVTIQVAVHGSAATSIEGLQIYANSELCTALGADANADSLTGYTFHNYSVPAKALNCGHLVIEIRSTAGMINIVHVDVLAK